MDYIREKLANIEDKRHPSYVEHNLADILIIIMCAVMCGIRCIGRYNDIRTKQSRIFHDEVWNSANTV